MAQETNLASIKAIAEWLRSHDDIAIVTHVFPDGDALGSSLALMMGLETLGKRAFVCDRDAVPAYLDLLPRWESVVAPDRFPFPPRAVIAVDCADAARMGPAGDLFDGRLDAAVIDHHVTNSTTITPALVNSQASASGVLVYQVLTELGVPLNRDIATCLYSAISTDTGNFNFSNTTPEALIAAAECIKQGIDVSDLSFRLFRMRTAGRTRLLGRALNNIEYVEDGQIAVLRLTLNDFAECHAQDADTEGVVNFGIDTEGAEIAILGTERVGSTKFSLRSRSRVDVAQIAASLGGGGHCRAAGVTLMLPLEEAVQKVLAACVQAIRA